MYTKAHEFPVTGRAVRPWTAARTRGLVPPGTASARFGVRHRCSVSDFGFPHAARAAVKGLTALPAGAAALPSLRFVSLRVNSWFPKNS